MANRGVLREIAEALKSAPSGGSGGAGASEIVQDGAPVGEANPLVVQVASVANVGQHGNAWDDAQVQAGGESNVVDVSRVSFVGAFGRVGGPTTIIMQSSQDAVHFYDTVRNTMTGPGDFRIALDIAAAYVRLKTTDAVRITATIAGKR